MHHVHAALSLPQCEDVRLIISEAGAAAAPAVVVPLAGIADRNRIHASGFEIDVKTAICEFAFAEHLPQQLYLKKPQPGDIAADGQHVGIVSGKGKTISASIITGTVVENDWGFRGKNKTPAPNMCFFRYTGEDK